MGMKNKRRGIVGYKKKSLVPFTQWLDNFGGGKCNINTREWHSNAVVNI